jgi:hypothetical protein
VTVQNSTFTNFEAIGMARQASVSMRDCTAPIPVSVTDTFGVFTFGNSIVGQISVAGTNSIALSQGNNIVLNSTHSGTVGFAETDQLNMDPLISSLGDYGGKIPTMSLLPGSPAIDKGNNSGMLILPYDQRRYSRIVDGDGDGTATVDIGAYEYLSTPLVTSVSGTVTDANGRPVVRATVTITDLDGSTQIAQTSPFGIYSFNNVAVGDFYLSVEAKSHRSAPLQGTAAPGGTIFNINVQ